MFFPKDKFRTESPDIEIGRKNKRFDKKYFCKFIILKSPIIKGGSWACPPKGTLQLVVAHNKESSEEVLEKRNFVLLK